MLVNMVPQGPKTVQSADSTLKDLIAKAVRDPWGLLIARVHSLPDEDLLKIHTSDFAPILRVIEGKNDLPINMAETADDLVKQKDGPLLRDYLSICFEDAAMTWPATMELSSTAPLEVEKSSRWYPNRLQWVIIWVAVLIAAHVWLGLRLSDFLPDYYGGWGLAKYLRPAGDYVNRSRLALTVLVFGGLLVWQVSGWRKK
jgi:hypothetical protein